MPAFSRLPDGLGGRQQFQARDPERDQADRADAQRARRLAQHHHAEHGRPYGADPGPDRIRGAQRQMAQPTLVAIASSVSTEGSGRVKPSVYFNPTAQATSSKPATTRYIQLISPFFPGLARSSKRAQV